MTKVKGMDGGHISISAWQSVPYEAESLNALNAVYHRGRRVRWHHLKEGAGHSAQVKSRHQARPLPEEEKP